MKDLILRYKALSSVQELDDLYWNNSIGIIYTISGVNINDKSYSGFIRIFRIGNVSTIQILYTDDCSILYRYKHINSNNWTLWHKKI